LWKKEIETKRAILERLFRNKVCKCTTFHAQWTMAYEKIANKAGDSREIVSKYWQVGNGVLTGCLELH
jgi:hypothetical protein